MDDMKLPVRDAFSKQSIKSSFKVSVDNTSNLYGGVSLYILSFTKLGFSDRLFNIIESADRG